MFVWAAASWQMWGWRVSQCSWSKGYALFSKVLWVTDSCGQFWMKCKCPFKARLFVYSPVEMCSLHNVMWEGGVGRAVQEMSHQSKWNTETKQRALKVQTWCRLAKSWALLLELCTINASRTSCRFFKSKSWLAGCGLSAGEFAGKQYQTMHKSKNSNLKVSRPFLCLLRLC